ncbi:hypothetical protein EPN96_06420 [bacterium]|nr:MAG: hypothetical protein EPN96_06420 [bacterium]
MNPKMVKLDTIPPEGKSLEFTVPADRIMLELHQREVKEVLGCGDMEVFATVMKSGPDVFVIGKFSVPVTLSCVRCLEEFSLVIKENVHLDLTTEPLGFENTPGEFELSAAELEVDHISGDGINLEELFIEQMILAIPEHPVCSPSCKGLCPKCGKKQAVSGCGCESAPPSSPFAVLAGLKPKK